jgi:hypothetical protein
MSIKITKDFVFMTALHFEGQFMTNLYEMTANMVVETEDAVQQNIAIERLSYFLTEQIENCIFINENDKEFIQKYKNAGMKVCTVPEDPYDQILGLILINKFNAIMENRIVVTDITFGSKLSNLVKFQITNESAEAEFPGNYWWNDNSANISLKKTGKEKIVDLREYKAQDWNKLDLSWK